MEISEDNYKDLNAICEEYPRMKVLVKEYLRDDKITILEYDRLMNSYRIIKQENVKMELIEKVDK